jgi:hypothetical protein
VPINLLLYKWDSSYKHIHEQKKLKRILLPNLRIAWSKHKELKVIYREENKSSFFSESEKA